MNLVQISGEFLGPISGEFGDDAGTGQYLAHMYPRRIRRFIREQRGGGDKNIRDVCPHALRNCLFGTSWSPSYRIF
jgi:hypothetical protein